MIQCDPVQFSSDFEVNSEICLESNSIVSFEISQDAVVKKCFWITILSNQSVQL